MLNPRNAAAVRGPNNDDLGRFRSLEDVLRSAGRTGDLNYRFSQAGALLFLLGAAWVEYADGVASPAEFGSISPDDFEDNPELALYQ